MTEVTVVIGSGSIGQAIARRVSAGRHVLLADLRPDNAASAAEVLRNAGFRGLHCERGRLLAGVRRGSRITGLIHAAGVSPSQASPETILRVDLCGTALVLEVFGGRRGLSDVPKVRLLHVRAGAAP